MAALVSIIIPTRERGFYLRHCLQTVLEIPDPDIEIVVSNNASTDDTADFLAGLADPRLKLLNTGKRLSMRQNFEFALDNSKGDYVIYIGDDDAFLPAQFHVLRDIIEKHAPESLSWSLPTYGWVSDNYQGKSGGVRVEKRFVYGALQEIDVALLRRNVLAANFEDYLPPTIYHGAARRDLMERHRAANGQFYNASCPDVYFTYLAIFNAARHFHVHHPITISGKSAASTGAAHNSKALKKDADNPATRFTAENTTDPIRDVVEFGVSVRGAYFQVLETTRAVLGVSDAPDYEGWIRFLLSDHKSHGPEEHAEIVRRARVYAETQGQTAAFEAAIRAGDDRVNRRRIAARWTKLKSKLQSFRVGVAIDGENTVHTAARVTDVILGTGYTARLNSAPDQTHLWREAVRRAKPYPKQF